jgi:hypothetical protein
VQSKTPRAQLSSSLDPGAACSYRRVSVDRVTAVLSFNLIRRKCLSITSLSAGGNVAILPRDLSVDNLVMCHGEILHTSGGKFSMFENKSKEMVHTAWNM